MPTGFEGMVATVQQGIVDVSRPAALVIELDEAAEARLQSEADTLGLSLEEYVRNLLADLLQPTEA